MRRALACLGLLFFFYRFDPYSLTLEIDGGHDAQENCEAQAATHGYFTVLLSSRPEFDASGKLLGYWRIACFDAPPSIRSATAIRVNVR